jgi:hypothetical protein
MKRLVVVVAILLLSAVAVPAARAAGDARALGDKVVRFCRAHLGKKVDTGQCSELAWDALKAAGAVPRLYPDYPNKGDYVWGKQVYFLQGGRKGPTGSGNLRQVRPGCVIQFHQTKGPGWNCAHHTAVVASIDYRSGTLWVYEQNVGGKKNVVEDQANLDDLKAGWIRIYRPVPARR